MNSFTPDYQIRLLAVLCLDKEYFLQVISHLEPTHFTLQVSQWLYENILKYYLEYKQLPTLAVIEQEYVNYDTPFLPEEVPLYNSFLDLLRVGSVPESEYVKASARQFITSRAIKTILNEQNEIIDAGDVDTVISQLKRGTQGLVQSTSGLVDKYVFSIQNLMPLYESGGIRTGISLIDQWVGGLYAKELTFILADTNVGKSLLMTFIGGQILRQYKKVLHITLEMSVARTLLRYYASLAENDDGNMTYAVLKRGEPLEQIYDYINTTLRNRYEGRFFIEEMPAGKTTIEDVGRLIDVHEPDVLILDYLDLMKPPRKMGEKRHELEELTTAIRELAKDKLIPILSATQANRTANNRRIVGVGMVSEDYNKMRIADVAIGMGQSLQDALRHEVVLYLAKARNDEKDKAERYSIDYARMQFHLVRPELLRQEEGEG